MMKMEECRRKKLEDLKVDVSGKIGDINLSVEDMEEEDKTLVKTTLHTKQNTSSNMCGIEDLSKKMENHSIKINVANSYGSEVSWLLRSDEDVYPIKKGREQ